MSRIEKSCKCCGKQFCHSHSKHHQQDRVYYSILYRIYYPFPVTHSIAVCRDRGDRIPKSKCKKQYKLLNLVEQTICSLRRLVKLENEIQRVYHDGHKCLSNDGRKSYGVYSPDDSPVRLHVCTSMFKFLIKSQMEHAQQNRRRYLTYNSRIGSSSDTHLRKWTHSVYEKRIKYDVYDSSHHLAYGRIHGSSGCLKQLLKKREEYYSK